MKPALLFLSLFICTHTFAAEKKYEKAVQFVKHLSRTKIVESNTATHRPGSVYDNVTYFESLLKFPRPGFNYEFIDSQLGTNEPLYPMYQKGYQHSWGQLLKAMFSEKNRHIDHYTSLMTPEGCLVDTIYLLRHLSEYPDSFYAKERAEGYDKVVIRLEYFAEIFPGAECGRHRSHPYDPKFNPLKYLKKYHNAMYLKDFPQDKLGLFEAKVALNYHITEQRGDDVWPRFDLEKLNHNSLWYYPEGHAYDFGINKEYKLPGFEHIKKAAHLVIESDPVKNSFPLSTQLSKEDFGKFVDFINGKPTRDFDPNQEPGKDTLRLSDVTNTNIYTAGRYVEKIKDVVSDVTQPSHYALVGITLKPQEEQDDIAWRGTKRIPQVRLVYQLMDPRKADHAFEQVYLHLKYDVVDRSADDQTRYQQSLYFLSKADQLTAAREAKSANYPALLEQFIREFTGAYPMESLSFSSSLTGIWVFGTLTRAWNLERELKALRVVREGIDVGYYSSLYDYDLFRDALKNSTGERKKVLEQHMKDLTVSEFRDMKRQDVHSLRFQRVTCAQCHLMSGRDGVHFSFNDKIDRRIPWSTRPSEFLIRDSELQLAIEKAQIEQHNLGK